MESRELLKNIKAAEIRIADTKDEKLIVKGSAYVRNLSAEVEWEETNRDTGTLNKYNSIISSLGWQWERHWNVYTEAAPFGLMLSELFEFLRSCIACNANTHSFIRWGWDTKDFHLISMEPAGNHLWHRCLSTLCLETEIPGKVIEAAGEYAVKVISKWDDRIANDREPFFVKVNGKNYLNCDPLCARLMETGFGGTVGSSPRMKFNLFKYIKSLPVLLNIYRSKQEMKPLEEKLDAYLAELKQMNNLHTYPLLSKYYSLLLEYNIMLYALRHFLPFGKRKYDKLKVIVNSKHSRYRNIGEENEVIAFWEDSGEVINKKSLTK